jgi:septum formation protein
LNKAPFKMQNTHHKKIKNRAQIMPFNFVYLASKSPRRSQLLDQMGVPHQLLLADADEDAEALEQAVAGEAPVEYVQRVTALKLDAAVQRLDRIGCVQAPIVCADTTVALGRRIFGKPLDAADAAGILGTLSNKTHQVLTAVAMQWGDRRIAALSVSDVRFARLSAEWIAEYVRSGEAFGKAGAYGVQGKAAMGIAQISGSYSGIMGLPVFETAQLLMQLKNQS